MTKIITTSANRWVKANFSVLLINDGGKIITKKAAPIIHFSCIVGWPISNHLISSSTVCSMINTVYDNANPSYERKVIISMRWPILSPYASSPIDENVI